MNRSLLVGPTALAGLALTAVLGFALSAPSGAGVAARSPSCADLPQGRETVELDPDEFTTRIDNPYWPMAPGTTWRYVEREAGEKQTVTVKVSRRTKVIEGVRARVVHDVVRDADGVILENTWDWFAQDSDGNIWYLGEFTQEYEDGVPVNSEGSFQHGQEGAQAGVVVPADPRPGCAYREEFLAGEAEDRARILSTTETIQTRFGLRHRVLQTANTTPLEPDILENKFYVRGLGPVLELSVSPDLGSAVLVKVDRPDKPR
ncbi:hypothetical protein [Nocardioides dilutus]